jgi:hypothetical protein
MVEQAHRRQSLGRSDVRQERNQSFDCLVLVDHYGPEFTLDFPALSVAFTTVTLVAATTGTIHSMPRHHRMVATHWIG